MKPICVLLERANYSSEPVKGLSRSVFRTIAKLLLQAGLNLNLAGAVSGLFSSKSKKTTNADGSSVEEKEEQASGTGESHRSVVC